MQSVLYKLLGILGTVFLLTAAGLGLNYQREDVQAQKAAKQAVSELKQQIKTAKSDHNENRKNEDSNNTSYMGYLTIQKLSLTLPVMETWDYKRLKQSPCRQFGSVEGDDLVIAAHNYKHHFGRLKELEEGDEILYFDCDGNKHTYQVKKITTVHAKDTELVKNSGYAFVMYTCTYGGRKRICVFCDRK